jgi:hypothetical protein
MIPIGTIIKWSVIGLIATALIAGVKKGYDYHLDQIDKAVLTAQMKASIEKASAVDAREREVRDELAREKAIIEERLDLERGKVQDLRKMLLIEHDLDRLLQEKPGLILPRVNRGTEEVLKELEEITQ